METAITAASAVEKIQFTAACKTRKATLNGLVDNKVLSKAMASKVAKSDLALSHLLLAHRRDPCGGISALFSEKVANGRRVIESKKITSAVTDHLSKHQA